GNGVLTTTLYEVSERDLYLACSALDDPSRRYYVTQLASLIRPRRVTFYLDARHLDDNFVTLGTLFVGAGGKMGLHAKVFLHFSATPTSTPSYQTLVQVDPARQKISCASTDPTSLEETRQRMQRQYAAANVNRTAFIEALLIAEEF